MKIPIVFTVLLGLIYSASCGDILVEVEQGWLAGEKVVPTCGNRTYYSYKGIPYAKAPLAELRFKAPEAPESWEGVRDATAYGNVCPEYNSLNQVFTEGSEDCLYLNVRTPVAPENAARRKRAASELLDVCVFIGSYAFVFDVGTQDYYIPDRLVDKDCVVVTFNFRLDSLGFLNLGTAEVPGNAGLKDQVAVLKWVQKNIEKFGGDPNKVTLIGHSSGSASAILHAVSPMSKGLFNRVVALSGTPSCDAIFSMFVKEKSYKLARTLGFNATDASEVLEFLQSVPYEDLISVPLSMIASEVVTDVVFKKMAHLVDVVEEDFGQERFLVEFPMKSLRLGNVNDVDIMFSYSSQETLLAAPQLESLLVDYNRWFEMWLPSKILFKAIPEKIVALGQKVKQHYFGENDVTTENFADFINYANFVSVNMEVLRTIRIWPSPKNTFLFRFSSNSARNIAGANGQTYGIEGPGHGDILNYIFSPKSLDNCVEEGTAEYDMIENLVTALMNFVKYGEPSPDGSLGVEWPQYDNDTKAYADFTDTVTIYNNPDEEDMAFWEEIVNEANIDIPW